MGNGSGPAAGFCSPDDEPQNHPASAALSEVRRWFSAPNVILLHPTPNHWDTLEKIGWTGADVSDAHFAALAIEHHAELHTNDLDFSNCPGLRWKNPLVP